MKKKCQIFISSTYSDLLSERQAAVEAILTAGHIPAGMELFSAGNESQLEVIKRWIDESDIYLLLLGSRYGSIEPKSGLSYTELEYIYAIEQKKPAFAIVSSKQYLENKESKFLEKDNLDKYSKFRETVLSRICKFFDDVKDIKYVILDSINDIQNRYQIGGWTRSINNSEEQPRYFGEWSGVINWTDEWATELMNPNKKNGFYPINPRAEGDVYIYCNSENVYKSFATWTLLNSDNIFSKSAVLGSNFVFNKDKRLVSFDFKAHSRKIMNPADEMGPSPLYRVVIKEDEPNKLIGEMTIPQFNDKLIGTLTLERE